MNKNILLCALIEVNSNIFVIADNKMNNMIQLRITEILEERGISKTQFADMMGVAKQNVNLLLETNNIKKLEQIAQVLNVRISDLWIDTDSEEEDVKGYLEYRNQVYKIKSLKDINEFLEMIENLKNK